MACAQAAVDAMWAAGPEGGSHPRTVAQDLARMYRTDLVDAALRPNKRTHALMTEFYFNRTQWTFGPEVCAASLGDAGGFLHVQKAGV